MGITLGDESRPLRGAADSAASNDVDSFALHVSSAPGVCRLDSPAEQWIQLSFFVLGLGTLLPWNAFLSCLDFYALTFPAVPVGASVSVAYFCAMSLASVALLCVPSRHHRHCTLAGFSLFALVSFLLPVVAPPAPVPGWESRELLITVTAIIVVGMANALTQSSLFAIAAMFPLGDCTHALNAGGGLAGLIAVLLRVASLLLVKTQPAAVVPAGSASDGAGAAAAAAVAAMRPEIWLFFLSCACVCLVCVSVLLVVTRSRRFHALIGESNHATLAAGRPSTQDGTGFLLAFRDSRLPSAAVYLSFFVTICLFPSLFTDLPRTGSWLVTWLSASSGAAEATWFVIVQVLVFSVGDYAGKSIPFRSLPEWAMSQRTILVASVARAFFFIPALSAAACGAWTPGDSGVFALAFALGLSNGAVVAAGLMVGPMLAPPHRRETAGRVMFLSLISGLCSGAVAGAALQAALRAVA
jgi:solute carrier family 29 (equilibrative nucleoside transporter), member 1/2/3